jgi:hypothetical protein
MMATAMGWILGCRWPRLGAGAGLAASVAFALPALAPAQTPFPDVGGSDAFESAMSVELIVGNTRTTLQLRGPTAVLRGAPRIEDDKCVIDTEIVALELSAADTAFGDVTVRINPARSSVGKVRSQDAGCVFPADSFFDVFVLVDVGILGEGLVNDEPVRVEAVNLRKLPPLFDTYTHPPPAIPLVGAQSGQQLAMIGGGSTHRPEQLPTFSVERHTSSLDPAALLEIGNPPLSRLRAVDLGLTTQDNVDALSFGLDAFGSQAVTTVAFSVDPNAGGVPGTGVALEAANDEAEGDEFVSQFRNTNSQLVDEQVFVLRSGPPSEDIDALVDQPPSLVDGDGDMVPNRPIFFSLDAGSPSLSAIAGATAASILVKNGAAPPMVFASEIRMGLRPGDDLDALCLMKSALPSATLRAGAGPPSPPPAGNATTDYALFSLAPGSPTLTALGVTQGDLLVTDFSAGAPAVYATAQQIGLLPSDNLDALKCLKAVVMIPLSGCVTIGGKLTINLGAAGHSGDPFGERGYDFWMTVDPQTGHRDGPFAVPEAVDDCGLQRIDPASLFWSPPDRCGAPHLHGFQFNHADPNPPVCGHGLFLGLAGTSVPVSPGMCALEAAEAVATAFNDTAVFRDNGFAASVHAISAVTTGFTSRGSAGPPPPAVLIVTGAGPSNVALQAIGVAGLTVGANAASLPLPLVESEPAPACAGDCDGGSSVTVDELVILVNIALGLQPVANCPPGNIDGNDAITVDEILMAVGNALSGCPG